MELNFHDNPVRHLQEYRCDTVYQEETAELIVPDSMPDIGRIIDCSGTVVVRNKDAGGGSMTVSGGIQAVILYVPEGENCLKRLETYISFNVHKDLPGQEGDCAAIYSGWLRSIDARMIHSRKVLVRANLGSLLCAYCDKELLVSSIDDPPKNLQMLQSTYSMLLPLCCGEKSFQISDEVSLPESSDGIEQILRHELSVEIEEAKMIGNKAVFKGELRLHILYRTDEDALHVWDGQVPFSQYAELEREVENGEVSIQPVLTVAEVDTDGQVDTRRLLVNVDILAQICVYGQQKVTLTEDAYATEGELEPSWQELSIPARLDSQEIRQTGELTVPVEAESVVDSGVLVDLPGVRRDQNDLWITAPMNVNVIYYDKEGQLQSRSVRGETSCSTALADSGVCRPTARCREKPSCAAKADGLTVQCPLEFTVDSYAGQQWRNLSAGTINPQQVREKRPSVIVRRAGAESIWEIAKNCKTTVSAVRTANGLETNAPKEGAILLIPMQ